MRVIVADDSAENLEAAQEAAEDFGMHQFSFLASPSQVLEGLENTDAVVTDLFFPFERGKEIEQWYKFYCSRITEDSPAFKQVKKEYYREYPGGVSSSRAEWNLNEMQKVLNFGVNGLYPYGGAVMLKAYELSKKALLISPIHSHALSDRHPAADLEGKASEGMILLLPLIERGLLRVKDGDGILSTCTTYMGYGAFLTVARSGRPDKTNPEVWKEAFSRVLTSV